MNRRKVIILFLLSCVGIIGLNAKSKRTWEFGIEGSVMEMERIDLRNISSIGNSYHIGIEQHNLLLGGGLVVAHELIPQLYLDMQGRFFYDKLNKRNHYLGQISTALQWRLAPYLKHDYFDPYLRFGVGYEYKNFSRMNRGVSQLDNGKEVSWENDRLLQQRHSFPLMVGVGLNLWCNDHWGLRVQTDYNMRFLTKESNSFQVSIGLNYRFGGKRRKAKPVVEIREVVKVVNKPIYIEKEKEIEKEVVKEFPILCKPVFFDFDIDYIKEGQEKRIDEIATVIKNEPTLFFLVTGTADTKGANKYNEDLALRRAKALEKALLERGVNPKQLKIRGIGERTTMVKFQATHPERQYDRRAFVEIVEDVDFWNGLK